MRNQWKKALAFLLSTATLFATAACGANGNGGSTSSDDGNKKSITLTFSDDQNDAYKTMAKLYTKETGVKVNIMEVPYSDLNTKISNASKAADLPDVARVPQLDPVWMGKLQDLTDLSNKTGVMKSLVTKDSKGEILQMPSDLTAVGMFINTSLFDKAGVSYPKSYEESWSWDEFIQAVTTVQKKTGAKYGFVMDPSTHRERSFMYSFGSKGVRKQKDGSWALDNKAKDALQFLKKIDNDVIMPKSVFASNADPSALFKTGQVAAYYSGNWQIADFINSISSFKWKSVVMPQQPTRATNLGTSYMVTFSKSGRKFLNWFYQKKNYTKFCEQGSYLPATAGISPVYAQRNEDQQLYLTYINKVADKELASHQIIVQLQATLAGGTTEEDPMKAHTLKYLTGEETLDKAISSMNAGYTSWYNATDD